MARNEYAAKTALIAAAEAGHIEVVKWLIKWGANPNIEYEKGETALDKAIKNGHYEIKNFIEKVTNEIASSNNM